MSLILDPEKYITFKRSEFLKVLESNAMRTAGALVGDELKDLEINDAVVIRRQDKFSSPCLLTYAVMIAMVAESHPQTLIREELFAISDYFHQQGILAGEEGWKLPTI